MSIEQDLGRVEGKIDMIHEDVRSLKTLFESHAKEDADRFAKIDDKLSYRAGKQAGIMASVVVVWEVIKYSFFGSK